MEVDLCMLGFSSSQIVEEMCTSLSPSVYCEIHEQWIAHSYLVDNWQLTLDLPRQQYCMRGGSTIPCNWKEIFSICTFSGDPMPENCSCSEDANVKIC